MRTNILCTLLNHINARKIIQFYLFRWEESKIVGRKYLHYNKGAKIWILGDLQNTSHVVKRYGAWPQTFISICILAPYQWTHKLSCYFFP